MPKHILIEKHEGETPLAALERARAQAGIEASVPMTYAGRLDPMASGALLLLVGDECKRKEEYLRLEKEYEFEVLLGIGSDSGDILGMPERAQSGAWSEEDVERACESLRGGHTLPYPRFSSKRVAGKQLFEHAHEGTLRSEDIPTRDMRVITLEYKGMRTMMASALFSDIEQRLQRFSPEDTGKTGSDFRKPEIVDAWRTALDAPGVFQIASCTARVSSGTYIRSLGACIGEQLGTRALAYTIHRSKILGLA